MHGVHKKIIYALKHSGFVILRNKYACKREYETHGYVYI